ncbi:MAG: hypothetical protein JJE09_15650 [Bacteroidia bacterium]|nr:hypothetical protein [Bacteroidia bacterium]
MKALKIWILTAVLLLPFASTELMAGTEVIPSGEVSTETPESARVKILLNRLEEIKALDNSKLTSAEKKQLRKEVSFFFE